MNYAISVLSLIVAGLLAFLLFALPAVNAWERNAGYPYGQMCNSVFTLYVDTCKKPL